MASNLKSLLSYQDIPKWQQSNRYLLSGYRAPSGSALACLASALFLNNETINIYSHLVGGFVFALLPIYFQLAFDPPLADAIAVAIFLEGVAICFLLSALFHTFENHNPSVSNFFHHLEHLGIVILMWGAGISMIHYGFLCDARLRTTYWTLMSCAAGSCAAVTFLPKLRTPQYHCWKVATYTSLGLTGLVFITHGLVVFGWETQNRRMPFLWMAAMAVTNLIGALMFVTRIPERWFPHKFDLVGCSHQIFHVAVIVAACLHFVTLVKASTSTRNETCVT
ncbi:mPR-like GPCR protein [Lasiosphaeris hirsuta]|uniref:MPR-like GPCR protein n=1 Tax=Lasiosphaeris hirsuta TaxID=260670 RepID=A0AA40DTX8_9PEZI|nr:mPR-like GPCR protein [Lasiosphaeris hirsuta]